MSRAIFEMRAFAESHGLSLKIWKRHPWDCAIDEQDRVGWWCQKVGYSLNPAKDEPEVYLGSTMDAARTALKAMAEKAA